MASVTEKQLDRAMDSTLQQDAEFARWLLARTKFADRDAKYFWSRANHPWGTIDFRQTDTDGRVEIIRKECETDVLVVFLASNGERLALHIENKLGSGKFTDLQPQMYRPRAEQWLGKDKYQNYTDFQTVLVAPNAFRERNANQVAMFDVFVSHEDIAAYIPEYGVFTARRKKKSDNHPISLLDTSTEQAYASGSI